MHAPPGPSPTPGPVGTATVAAAGTNLLLAGGGTISTLVGFPSATAGVGATLTVTASTTPPNGIATAAGRRSPQSTASILEYLIVQSTAAATFSGTPALSFVLPAADVDAAGIYALELYDSTNPGPGFVVLSTGTLNGSTLTFAAGTTAFTIPVTPAFVVFALKLTVPGPSPSPTPTATASATPSGSPTPTPTPGSNTVTANPTYLIFAGPTAPPQTLTITETNGAVLTESDNCTAGGASIVTLVPTPSQNMLSVLVTPHVVGTCAITYRDPAGNAVSVGVTVSNPAPIVIQ